MKEFPNKIILSQDKDTKELSDYWVLNDYTDMNKKEYVQLDKVIEWIKQQKDLLEDSFSDPGDFADLLKEAMNKPIYE